MLAQGVRLIGDPGERAVIAAATPGTRVRPPGAP
jgi:hypothetical protein